MNKEQLINLLNDDLSNEYKHMHFYLHSSFMIQGLHREELSEFLAESAADEFKHVQEFAKLIVGLDGIPTTVINPFPSLTDPKEILQYAFKMETEVTENYVNRMGHAAELGGVSGRYVEIFLEDQLIDSRTDADHIKEMLKGV